MSTVSKEIIRLIGGLDNIKKLENCMTRVRLILHDETLFKGEEIKKLTGVMGVNKVGEQLQIIVGPGASSKIKDEIQLLLDSNTNNAMKVISSESPESLKEKIKNKYSLGGYINDFLKNIANIFVPLIPALIGCGLILGIANILKNPAITGNLYSNYKPIIDLIFIFGNSIFFVMLVFVGISTSRVYGGSIAIGAAMAGILTHPGLASLEILGEKLTPGRGGVIAIILVVAFACYVEKQLKKFLSGTFDLILNPIIVVFISGIVAIFVLQPLGGFLSDSIANITVQAITSGGALVGFILAGAFLPIVMTGLHQGLIPIHLQLITDTGMTPLFTILAMAGAGQVGAALAVLLKTKNPRIKKITKSALPVGLLGIGEPLIYGVTLPLGKPFLTACLGGACGGAVIAFFKVGAISIGTGGLPLLLAIGDNKYLYYALGLLSAYISGFVITYLVGFKDPIE